MSPTKEILHWLIHGIAFFKIFFNSVVCDSHKPKQAIKAYKSRASATNIVHLLKLEAKQIPTINAKSYHWITISASFLKRLH